jgi:hypothetical protein
MLFDPCPLLPANMLCAFSRSLSVARWSSHPWQKSLVAFRKLALHQADSERPSWPMPFLRCRRLGHCAIATDFVPKGHAQERLLKAAGHSLRYASTGSRRSPSISLMLFRAGLPHRTCPERTSPLMRLADDEDRCTLRSDHRWLPYPAAPALLMTIAPSASRREEPLWTFKSMHGQDSIPKTILQASAVHRANSKPRVELRPFVPLHLLGGPPF